MTCDFMTLPTAKKQSDSEHFESLPTPVRRCLSARQSADYLGVGTTLFSQLDIPAIRLGRRIVYDRVDLDTWLDDYKSRGRAIKEELWPEKKDSTEGRTHRTGGLTQSSRTDAEYVKVLGLKS